MSGDRVKKEDVTWANGGVLGLACFGFSTILLNVHNIGWIPATIPVIWGLFWGGAAQLVAGIIEARRGDTFAFTAFISYGFFWIGLGFAFLLEWLGVIVLDGPSLAWTMIVWGIFSGYMAVGSFRISRAHGMLFTSATVLFGLLAGHFLGLVPVEVAGAEGIFVGVNACYISAAMLINVMYGRWILPIGLFPRK